MKIGAAMALWGFCMTAALSERCGHSWSVSLEAGAADAVVLFLIASAMVTVAGRRER